MEDRYVIFEEWSGPKIFAIPIGQTARLLNEHLDRKPRVFDSLAEAKQAALALLSDTSATKVTLPFIEERLSEARTLMGDDFWSYGVEPNRKTLETFLRHHNSQGLSPRLLKPEELFYPGTLEAFKV